MPATPAEHTKNAALLQCAMALFCELMAFFTLNMSIYPAYPRELSWALDSATILGVVIMLVFFALLSSKPKLFDYRKIGIATLVLLVLYIVCARVGIMLNNDAIMVAGLILESLVESWILILVYTSVAQLDVKEASFGVTIAFAAAYLLQAVAPQNLMFLPELHGGLLVFAMACAHPLSSKAINKLREQEPSLDLAATNPRSFLPAYHLIYITVLVFGVAQGLAFSYASADGMPSLHGFSAIPLVIIFLVCMWRQRRLNADWVFLASAVFVVAGLVLLPTTVFIRAPHIVIASNSLLNAGAACFDLTIVLFVVYYASRNKSHAPQLAAYMVAMKWLGIEVGVLMGHVFNGFVANSDSMLFWVSFAQTLVFVAFCLIVAKKVNFMNVMEGMQPALSAAQLQVPDKAPAVAGVPGTTGSAELLSMHERCFILAGQCGLTPRETEILELLAAGRTLAVIKEKLVISPNTVRYHTKNIYSKLGVHAQQELIDMVEAVER